ncbi:bifunctional cytidylyltransferase/SDR family oxidoreductase [Microbacterium sp. EYE_5]|uniref:SDR family NAD(P)-dependent oxidoreductase n=1 Tax=unclassified Microbacterium TaxID=2609290 RepID=UPI00200606C3|nr:MULTISPECIES: bifunctional cytidylyltransferase/SDR family oxidoreductase [unclassified Microbacterium]MCK6081514.1 bifunctional cytidylyltransferase/SDR family oxidoreductase [Microbacterium sp. EYE_382]MCK6086784.1 bifunctional cytidylyltransferase/SDR family oxidoreductase [Microbacterium sp. EYE_384]MCK6123718.1 bifunctional cytidylyltransferase/SDR family oxidoreductase [Microbacterium sp. EYE_80]MCK6126627.1 bifunctional cytidylyltransferase/SDR family oxidoreductase [Microbacterium sp
MSRPRTVAVVLAGGIGVRVGLGIPKQLIKIAGKAIVEHTLEALEASGQIDEIVIMMNAAAIGELDHLVESGRFAKLSRILPGGETRNDTTRLAIDALDGDDTRVLFHDAVRPFIDDRIIEDCVRALDDYEAVDTAIPSADTIIQVDADRRITGIPDRSLLRRGQTPQAFRLGTIRRAYEIAATDPDFRATDDCGVVFTYLPEVPIYVVDGTAENMKVTEPIDVHIADKLFQLQSASLSLESMTSVPDLAGKSVVVFGGSYGIGESIVTQATAAGATVHEFSRTTTGTDIRSAKAVRSALAAAHGASGRIDVVIVTAGVLRIAPLIESRKRDLKDTIQVNLIAPAIVAREAHPYLAETAGQVVLFTSSSYTRGRAGYSAYSATKAGVVNLTQALAEEWEASRVRINCINPQRTRTPMRTQAFGEEPADSLLDPADVARVTLNVAASDLTGQIVTVNVAAMRGAAG